MSDGEGDRKGCPGWRKAFLGLWTASFVLVLALGMAILPGRVGNLQKLHQAAKIPLPGVVEGAVRVAAWLPENLALLAAVWGAGVAGGLLAPRGPLKLLTALSALTLLAAAGAAGALIHLTDPTRVPMRPPPIPLGGALETAPGAGYSVQAGRGRGTSPPTPAPEDERARVSRPRETGPFF